MDKNGKMTVGAVLAIVVIGYGIYYYNHRSSPNQDNSQQPGQQQTTPNPAPQASLTKAETAGKKLPYAEAVNTYKNRFQFSQCHGNPGMLSVKIGVPVMLDNRDNATHAIKANGQSIKIAPYDYAILYPAKVTVGEVGTGSSNVTCDGGGSVVLNVEK